MTTARPGGIPVEMAERVEAIKQRLKILNDLTEKLNQAIKHEKANNHFLAPIRNTLMSVETELLPWAAKASTPSNAAMFLSMAEFELRQAEAALNHAQEMVRIYGEDIQVIGE